jgi:tetratricopeptide (TPR) repeat protein
MAPQAITAADAQAHDTESAVVEGQLAPRLQKLGNYAHPITTSSPRAQLFFNQALNLAYGFNHREAKRSFQEAARLDPEAAMAYWGQALVLGPNINAPMQPEAEPEAYELVQAAVSLKQNVSQKERAFIGALAARYSGDKKPDRSALDRAYAEAMRKVHERYPDDLDAATLYAESLMNLRPWNYWTPDGKPYPETVEILKVLESVVERNPNHPGAAHLYIHAVEAVKPALAEAAADRLVGLVPGSGHLQHMPSHIYVRVGRYEDASHANTRAIAADEDYITQCRAQGIYPLAYYPHNIHFFWLASAWEGRSKDALRAANEVDEKTRENLDKLPVWGQIFAVVPLYALARFGKWEEILERPQPPEDKKYWRGIWHYARGLAYTRTDRRDQARSELEKLGRMAGDQSLKEASIGANNVWILLNIASSVLAGEIAAERGDYDEAVAHLHRGVLLEGSLVYTEPPDWYYPVRQSLGAVLLAAGRPLEAEVVYWEDLKHNPNNGWSLFGLMKSLKAQGKDEEASAIEERFRDAWARADVKLASSRF